MKKYLLFSLILVSKLVFSQSNSIKKADQLFASYQYVDAINSYLKIIENKQDNPHVYNNLADCYYYIYNITEAAKWYEKVVENNSESEVYFRYAQVLKSLGKNAESNEQMLKFTTLAPNDVRSKEYFQNQESAFTNTKINYKIEKTSLSEANSNDYAGLLATDNQFYWVSTRKNGKLDKWSNAPYIDMFKATRNLDGSFSNIEEIKELNSNYHDGPVTISEDGNTMYFARDSHSINLYNKDKSNNAKIGQLGIYKAKKINGKWEIIEGLPINNVSYSVTHPALSKDGKTLYFASNMPGGIGESDIWKIAVLENGYGAPVNLGNKINTPSREVFPFISSENELYFSSTGWSGFGGLDIFKVENNSYSINIGKPINSEKDDFSFTFNSMVNKGFFASNRNGNDAIYEATPLCGIEMHILVTDAKTNKAIENAQINILDENNVIVFSTTTNASGNGFQNLECDKSYALQIIAKNYENFSLPIAISNINKIEIPVKLNPIDILVTDKEVLLGDVYFEFNKSNITPLGATQLDKLVKLLNSNPTMIIFVKSHTDSSGNLNYNLKLSEERAQATVQYVISKGINKNRIYGKGYGFSEPKIKCNPNCTEEENSINRRSEFIIIKK
ncbi:OmpA family protein [Flavobacterium sp. 20NA77.7]|uniref:OmpA family protein n=1 Tax=Flavobacterium nakdongensis TaxID=3073563 RepID=A0ABY9RBT7_9FLAO|nr:OmpA family protein [Flavobacterium sp. 20NA77.7]WMW77785.1 OmpA family protein [Flavobacterium sp. 20NA77.7]